MYACVCVTSAICRGRTGKKEEEYEDKKKKTKTKIEGEIEKEPVCS